MLELKEKGKQRRERTQRTGQGLKRVDDETREPETDLAALVRPEPSNGTLVRLKLGVWTLSAAYLVDLLAKHTRAGSGERGRCRERAASARRGDADGGWPRGEGEGGEEPRKRGGRGGNSGRGRSDGRGGERGRRGADGGEERPAESRDEKHGGGREGAGRE